MSLRARSRIALKAIETVDEVDLSRFDQLSLRAILLPKSESALHSIRLEENDSVVCLIAGSIPLLSPCNSSSEDEGSTQVTSKSHTHTTTRRRSRSQGAIILEQPGDKERFTLGASWDNDVVLKHPDAADGDRCYINLVHVQLYPDPDHNALILFNSSTSAFSIRSLAIPEVDNDILPGQDARLHCGSWQLSLGRGLDFQIKVMSRTSGEVHDDWSLISPPKISSLPARRSGKAAPIVPTKTNVRQPPSPTPKSKAGSVSKSTGASCAGDKAATGPEDSELRPPSSSMQESHSPYTLIGKTNRTLVFKATRKEAIVAIKVCRKPTVKESADTWRNEIEIMSCLNHVSNTRGTSLA